MAQPQAISTRPSQLSECDDRPANSRPTPFVWTRSETLGLADQSCTHCWGFGLRPSRGGKEVACACVFRKIFAVCYARYRRCNEEKKYRISHIYREDCGASPRHGRPHIYGFKNEEYVADFLHIARDTLGDTLLYQIFRWHFIMGLDFRAINRKIGREPGNRCTFHFFSRIEERLGRAFRETYPYALFPLDEYFGGTVRKAKVIPFPARA